MKNISTLNKINRSDNEIAGFRAVDLATLFNKKINIPICFVVNSSLFESFFNRNNLRSQIDDIKSKVDYEDEASLDHAYSSIKELITNAEFSGAEQNELVEAYETLAIDMDHIDIAKLVTTIDKPFLTLIASPNYVDDSENNEGVIQNIKEKVSLFRAIKNCWISMYSPRSLKYRYDKQIEGTEKMAVIIQRMIESQVSAETYSDEEEIIVKTYLGYQDYEEEFGKDVAVFSKGTLGIKNSKIGVQEQQYVRDIKDNTLIRKDSKVPGEKQKINDKEAEELARITKKVEGFLEKPVKAFFGITKGKIYLLFANRIIRNQSEEVEEEDIQETDTSPSSESEPKEAHSGEIVTDPDKVVDTPPKHATEKPISTEPEDAADDLEEDIKFLDEIESYEKEAEEEEKEASPEDKEESETPKPEKEEPEHSPIHDHGEHITHSKETPIVQDAHTPEPPARASESTEEEIEHFHKPKEEESEWAADDEYSAPKTETTHEETNEKTEPQHESETPIKLEEEPEDDEFIFSQFEEDEEKKESKPEETKTEEPISETKPEAQTEAIEASTSKPDDPEGGINEIMGELRKVVILSDDQVFEKLRAKHKEILNEDVERFHRAIDNLKNKINIPFLEDIQKCHEIRKKLDKGEEVSVDDASLVIRTSKNFLSMFH